MSETKMPWSEENRWSPGGSTEDALVAWYARKQGGVFMAEWPIARGDPWHKGTKPRRLDALRVVSASIGPAGVWKGINEPEMLGVNPTLEAIEAKKKLTRSVIGQALVGARMLVRDLPGARVVPVVLCEEGDLGLELIAAELGVRVVVELSGRKATSPTVP